MKVKLVSYTPEPLKTLAKTTLVSYWDEWSIDKLDKITEKDAEMHIPRVLGYGHESILEQVNITFAIEGMSRVTSHQFVRHRHMSIVQRSQRYIREGCYKMVEQVYHTGNINIAGSKKIKVKVPCSVEDMFAIPESIKNVKELYDELIETPYGDEILEVYESNELAEKVKEHFKKSYELYQKLIEAGVPPEDARYVLPQAIKTKMVVTMNLREFKHFLGLRMCERAQWEIRELAWKMWKEAMKIPDLKKIMIWGKFGPKCVGLGYCPEGELMPEGCLARQRKLWKSIRGDEV